MTCCAGEVGLVFIYTSLSQTNACKSKHTHTSITSSIIYFKAPVGLGGLCTYKHSSVWTQPLPVCSLAEPRRSTGLHQEFQSHLEMRCKKDKKIRRRILFWKKHNRIRKDTKSKFIFGCLLWFQVVQWIRGRKWMSPQLIGQKTKTNQLITQQIFNNQFNKKKALVYLGVVAYEGDIFVVCRQLVVIGVPLGLRWTRTRC